MIMCPECTISARIALKGGSVENQVVPDSKDEYVSGSSKDLFMGTSVQPKEREDSEVLNSLS